MGRTILAQDRVDNGASPQEAERSFMSMLWNPTSAGVVGRNKTDGVVGRTFASIVNFSNPNLGHHLRAYRRLGELQTIRAGVVAAMRYNPVIVSVVTRLKSRGRLRPKEIAVAAMRKLLVLCFGVLKTDKPFNPSIAMGGC